MNALWITLRKPRFSPESLVKSRTIIYDFSFGKCLEIIHIYHIAAVHHAVNVAYSIHDKVDMNIPRVGMNAEHYLIPAAVIRAYP